VPDRDDDGLRIGQPVLRDLEAGPDGQHPGLIESRHVLLDHGIDVRQVNGHISHPLPRVWQVPAKIGSLVRRGLSSRPRRAPAGYRRTGPDSRRSSCWASGDALLAPAVTRAVIEEFTRVRDRVQAVIYAYETGLVTPSP
jgi:hypothetical protein